MEKQIIYNKKDKILSISFPFTDKHTKTLLTVYQNGNEAIFENRNSNTFEDLNGNEISWKICDELVEMGLLSEDEEAYDVYFEMTNEGLEIIFDILNNKV